MFDSKPEPIAPAVVVARCLLAFISILQLILVLLLFVHGLYADGWNGASAIAVTVVVSRPLLDIQHCWLYD